MIILVDTSVWVDFFRGVDSSEATWLTTAVAAGENLCICGPVFTEILQGVVSDAECRKVKGFLSPFIYLQTMQSTYNLAAEIYRTARKKGKTIRNTVDCVIAACAIENSAELLQRDKDFLVIADVSKLKLVKL